MGVFRKSRSNLSKNLIKKKMNQVNNRKTKQRQKAFDASTKIK